MTARHHLAASVLLVLAAGSAAAAAPSSSAAVGQEAFELVKSLDGDWIALGEDGNPTERLVATYRVTAGGHAVLSTEFPGSDHEMVSVYHLDDGGRLVMTHYCMLGNRPHFDVAASGRTLKLACDGSGVASESEQHVHAGTLALADDGTLTSSWSFVGEDGESSAMEMRLARRE